MQSPPRCLDVTRTEHEGRWLATAMLADEPDIGTGSDPREALRAALGEPPASEMAAGAEMLGLRKARSLGVPA